jgi:hypothetical protein
MKQENESSLKSELMQQFKLRLPNYVALRHEDVRTAGIPDISLTGYRRTTWLEAKHDDDDGFKSTGIQELTMLRLASAGCARYIIWQEKKGIRRTLIVHPKGLKTLDTKLWCAEFNFDWLVEQVERVHLS